MPITRRHSLRRTMRLQVSMGRRLPAITANVSRGGFSAEMPQVFLPGSKVHGYLMVDQAEVEFRGTVAWAEPGNPMLSVFSRIGVTFDSLPSALRSLLDQHDRRPRRLRKPK